MFNEKKLCVQPRRLEQQGLRCAGTARGSESLVAITL
jgi:hypothetical protein